MVKVALIDSGRVCSEVFNTHIKRYGTFKKQKIIVRRFNDGSEIASDYKPKFDYIFLRVKKQLFGGIDAVKSIRKFDAFVPIILIADTEEYAIKGFDYDVAGYMLMPLNYEVLFRIMERLWEASLGKHEKFILFSQENGIVKLACRKIMYVESQAHLITIHCTHKDFKLFLSLKEIEKKINLETFVRCNNSYLVNLEYVDCVRKDMVHIGDDIQLKISKYKKKAFIEKLTRLAYFQTDESL